MLSTLAFAVLAVHGQDLSAEQIYDQTSRSVLTLSVERGNGTQSVGTAFLALQPGVAVTAWHVVKGARTVKVKFSDGTETKVKGVIDKNPDLDIALISLDAGDRAVLPVAASDPRIGSKAYVIGAPRGQDFSISDGIVSQTPYMERGKLYQFTCPVSPGNSGGPLLNARGEVMGVVSWQFADAQNLNFAVPVRNLDNLDVAKAAVAFAMPNPETGRTIPAVTDTELEKCFERSDLSFSKSDDGTGKTAYVLTFNSTKVSLFQYTASGGNGPTLNLGLSAGYSSDTRVPLEKLNTFNRSYRFVRSYRDTDGTVYIENDLPAAFGLPESSLQRFLTEFGGTVQQFEASVLGKGRQTSARRQEPATGTELAVSVLKELGLKPTNGTDGRIDFKTGGYTASLFCFGGDEPDAASSLTVSVGFDTGGQGDLARVNEYNRSCRFNKGFIDEDGDPICVADFILDAQTSRSAVRAFFTEFTKAVPLFDRAVNGKP